MHNGDTIIDLVKDLKHQAQTFIREEFQLAKTELTQKLTSVGKDAISIAIGGVLAYAGLIVFLGGLGVLLAWAFEKLGLSPYFSLFLGLGIMGFLVLGAGAAMALAGVAAVKKQALAPQRTLRTWQHLSGQPSASEEASATMIKIQPVDTRTPEQLEADIIKTEDDMAETLRRLQARVSVTNFKRQARAEVQRHPYRWSLAAAASGMAATYLVGRKLNHAAD